MSSSNRGDHKLSAVESAETLFENDKGSPYYLGSHPFHLGIKNKKKLEITRNGEKMVPEILSWYAKGNPHHPTPLTLVEKVNLSLLNTLTFPTQKKGFKGFHIFTSEAGIRVAALSLPAEIFRDPGYIAQPLANAMDVALNYTLLKNQPPKFMKFVSFLQKASPPTMHLDEHCSYKFRPFLHLIQEACGEVFAEQSQSALAMKSNSERMTSLPLHGYMSYPEGYIVLIPCIDMHRPHLIMKMVQTMNMWWTYASAVSNIAGVFTLSLNHFQPVDKPSQALDRNRRARIRNAVTKPSNKLFRQPFREKGRGSYAENLIFREIYSEYFETLLINYQKIIWEQHNYSGFCSPDNLPPEKFVDPELLKTCKELKEGGNKDDEIVIFNSMNFQIALDFFCKYVDDLMKLGDSLAPEKFSLLRIGRGIPPDMKELKDLPEATTAVRFFEIKYDFYLVYRFEMKDAKSFSSIKNHPLIQALLSRFPNQLMLRGNDVMWHLPSLKIIHSALSYYLLNDEEEMLKDAWKKTGNLIIDNIKAVFRQVIDVVEATQANKPINRALLASASAETSKDWKEVTSNRHLVQDEVEKAERRLLKLKSRCKLFPFAEPLDSVSQEEFLRMKFK